MKRIYRLTIIAMVFASASCSGDGKLLKKEDFGESWPLTVDECYVRCDENYAIVIAIDGVEYAANNSAKKTGKYMDIGPVTKVDPNYPGQNVKMKLSDLEFEGLKICE